MRELSKQDLFYNLLVLLTDIDVWFLVLFSVRYSQTEIIFPIVNMHSKSLLYLVSFLAFSSVSGNSTVEYYVNLINEEIARSLTFPLPTDASDFKTNSSEVSGQSICTFNFFLSFI